jgi:glycosyltransferase involved in cell wall biosynthesis
MKGHPALHDQKQKTLLHIFPTFAVGGSQMRFARLATALGERYRHTVIALDGNFEMSSRVTTPITCERLTHPEHGTLRPVFNAVCRLMKSQIDTIVTYNWGSMNWCLANRLWPRGRHVHIEDGFGPEEQSTQIPRRVWMRRMALSAANTVTVVPSRQLETIARDIWRLPQERLLYIPNGIDCARFAAAGRERATHTSTLTLGTVATLRREKDLGQLIRLFQDLSLRWPNLKLLIVGDGPERANLETAAHKTGMMDRITFTGPSSQPEKFLAQMDVFVLTSLTEQMPLSVLEAMAAQLPVLSPDVGDVSSMVAAENRDFIVPARDHTALTNAACKLLASAELRENIGTANQEAAISRFDEQEMVARYAEILG